MIQAIVNGKKITTDVGPRTRLIDFLRNEMGLTGTKEGCSEGECGACTVIFNGRAVTSCTMLLGQLEGGTLMTIEGLQENGELDRIQQSFIEKGAIQCGFCSPGMILSVKALLLHNENPSDEEIRRAIEGNLCRCTGYAKIIDAVHTIVGEKK